jgi:hypothetical protein
LSRDGQVALSGSQDHAVKLLVLDWELEATQPVEIDEKVQTYLKVFLAGQIPYAEALPKNQNLVDEDIILALIRPGQPTWTEADFEQLYHTLGCAGYGLLQPDAVRNRLETIAQKWTGPPSLSNSEPETNLKGIEQTYTQAIATREKKTRAGIEIRKRTIERHKRTKLLMKIFGIVGTIFLVGCILLIIGSSTLGFILNQQVIVAAETTGDQFMTALQEKNYVKAHMLLTPGEQSHHSASWFEQQSYDKEWIPVEWVWSDIDDITGLGTRVTLEGSAAWHDGCTKSQVRLSVVKVNGDWKIDDWSFRCY